MATEKWASPSAWTTAITSSALNSLVSSNAILGDIDITNGSSLDFFVDFSLVLGSAAFIAPNFISLYLYPLSDDASHYGDGRFGTAAAGPPSSTYWKGNIEIVATTAAQYGQLCGIVMPPGTWRPVLWNKGGVNWASSGNTLKCRTYDRAIA